MGRELKIEIRSVQNSRNISENSSLFQDAIYLPKRIYIVWTNLLYLRWYKENTVSMVNINDFTTFVILIVSLQTFVYYISPIESTALIISPYRGESSRKSEVSRINAHITPFIRFPVWVKTTRGKQLICCLCPLDKKLYGFNINWRLRDKPSTSFCHYLYQTLLYRVVRFYIVLLSNDSFNLYCR